MKAAVFAIVLVTPLLAAAAEEPAKSAPAMPPLTRTVVSQEGDSPLVRAAKAAVAKRQGTRSLTIVIDNEMVKQARGDRVAEPTHPAPPLALPPPPEAHGGTPVPPPPPRADKEGVDRKLKQLKQEEVRLHEELDQPNVDEDSVAKRLAAIQSEAESLRKSLDPHPPPPPKP